MALPALFVINIEKHSKCWHLQCFTLCLKLFVGCLAMNYKRVLIKEEKKRGKYKLCRVNDLLNYTLSFNFKGDWLFK